MTEHKVHVDYEKMLYTRSVETLKVHGILSIIFGSLGVVSAILITVFFAIGSFVEYSYSPYTVDSSIGFFMISLMIFIFWTLPHIYLIVSGSYLVRQPSAQLAKALVIINLVVGLFWNLILLIFAIINLTQIADYERLKK